MRWLLRMSMLAAVLLLPAKLEAQGCGGVCTPNDDWTKFTCEVAGLDEPGDCNGDFLGIFCFSCRGFASSGDALDLQVYAVDGSVSQSDMYREALRDDPTVGLTGENVTGEKHAGSIVVYACTGAIAARSYAATEAIRLRRESMRIVI